MPYRPVKTLLDSSPDRALLPDPLLPGLQQPTVARKIANATAKFVRDTKKSRARKAVNENASVQRNESMAHLLPSNVYLTDGDVLNMSR